MNPLVLSPEKAAIPSNHDMALSQTITCRCPMDHEVKGIIVQLLEQNQLRRIMVQNGLCQSFAGATYPKFSFLVGFKFKI